MSSMDGPTRLEATLATDPDPDTSPPTQLCVPVPLPSFSIPPSVRRSSHSRPDLSEPITRLVLRREAPTN